jgi:hypothetical protein
VPPNSVAVEPAGVMLEALSDVDPEGSAAARRPCKEGVGLYWFAKYFVIGSW